MADPEQVKRLTRSVEKWNQWRRKHPEICPDLSYADLSRANLYEANLSNADLNRVNFSLANLSYADLSSSSLSLANLSYADLSSADLNDAYLGDTYLSDTHLSGANFSEADLSRTNLSNANLSEANLNRSNLFGADLFEADLFGANLSRANLSRASLNRTNITEVNLSKANVTDVHFFYTTFAWVDLASVRGLETVIHEGPSIVDINSVNLPHDEHIRRHFLRGVGFSEIFIEYLPSLLVTPIQYRSLFISYSHHDQTFAKRLHTDLQNKGVRCWFALHDLRPGTPIVRGIEEAIHLHEKLLLILSKHAVDSRWIELEVDAALYQEIKSGQDVLFPIRLDNAVLESTAGWAVRLQHRHIGDFTGWQDDTTYQQAFTTLLRHLKVAKPPTAQ